MNENRSKHLLKTILSSKPVVLNEKIEEPKFKITYLGRSCQKLSDVLVVAKSTLVTSWIE